jgi:hypothetical protein
LPLTPLPFNLDQLITDALPLTKKFLQSTHLKHLHKVTRAAVALAHFSNPAAGPLDAAPCLPVQHITDYSTITFTQHFHKNRLQHCIDLTLDPTQTSASYLDVTDVFVFCNLNNLRIACYASDGQGGVTRFQNHANPDYCILFHSGHCYYLGASNAGLNFFRAKITADKRWDFVWNSPAGDGNCVIHALSLSFQHTLEPKQVRDFIINATRTAIQNDTPITLKPITNNLPTLTADSAAPSSITVNVQPAGGLLAPLQLRLPTIRSSGYLSPEQFDQLSSDLTDPIWVQLRLQELQASLTEMKLYLAANIRQSYQEARATYLRAVGPFRNSPAEVYIRAQFQTRGSAIYRRVGGHYVPLYHDCSVVGEFDYFFDGDRLLRVTSTPDGAYVAPPETSAPYLLAHEAFRLFQAPRILHSIQDLQPQHVPAVVAHRGPPGNGKTTSILSAARDGDLIVTAFRDTADDTRKRLLKLRPDSKIRIATIDSYLINRHTKHARVFVDEYYAVHAGSLAAVIAKSECHIIIGYGDPVQLRAVSRVFNFDFHSDTLPFAIPITLTLTYRCPADVCAALQQFYPGLRTRNPQRLSLTRQKILSIQDVEFRVDTFYMTYTQHEKQQLLDHFRARTAGTTHKPADFVATVHEAQGTDHRATVLVRLNTKKLAIFDSEPHTIVAISRHTRSFTYQTVSQERDLCSKLIDKAQACTVSNFQAAELLPESFDVRPAGALPHITRLTTKKPFVCYDDERVAIRDDVIHNLYLNQLTTPHTSVILENYIHQHGYPHHVTPMHTTDLTALALQTSYNSAMVGQYQYTEEYLNLAVQLADLETAMPMTIKPNKGLTGKNNTFTEPLPRRSVLHTLQPWPHAMSQRQLVIALNKRNGDAHDDSAFYDMSKEVDSILDYGFDTYCLPQWRQILKAYQSDPISINREAIDSYLVDNPHTKWQRLKNPMRNRHPARNDLHIEDLIRYASMIKSEPKNRLDPDAINTYQALQTIIHHMPIVNVLFSFFRQLFDRFQRMLNPNVFVQLKKSAADLEQHLDTHVPPGASSRENDFRMFDKSQLEKCMLLELEFYRRLGLDLYLAACWETGITLSVVKSILLAVRIIINYQRRSGAITTAFGNTVVNMFTCAWVLRLHNNFYAVYFIGDDSSIFLRTFNDPVHMTHRFKTDFNLESKIIDSTTNYFCSGFLIHNGRRWLYMPDPVKRTERLSYPQKHLTDSEFHEKHNSLVDMLHNYNDANAVQALQKAVFLRYGGAQVAAACSALASITRDYGMYRSLYRS